MKAEEYHIKQYESVYRSTEKFVDWLEASGYLGVDTPQRICDIACGGGANLAYLSRRYKNSRFTGIDISHPLICYGAEKLRDEVNCELYQGDWFHLDTKWRDQFDGIISFQTLSWLSEYHEPLRQLAELNPKWIAISSLFYEGDIEYSITLKNYYRVSNGKEYEKQYYNIYSLIRVRKHLETLGYREFHFIPFEIDIDLPKPESMDVGTYTIKTEENKRLQISAALMMPWYFIVASK